MRPDNQKAAAGAHRLLGLDPHNRVKNAPKDTSVLLQYVLWRIEFLWQERNASFFPVLMLVSPLCE